MVHVILVSQAAAQAVTEVHTRPAGAMIHVQESQPPGKYRSRNTRDIMACQPPVPVHAQSKPCPPISNSMQQQNMRGFGRLAIRQLPLRPGLRVVTSRISMATQAAPEDAQNYKASQRWSASFTEKAEGAVPIYPISQADCEAGLGQVHGPLAAGLATANKFKAKAGDILLVPHASTGQVERVLLGISGNASGLAPADLWAYAALPPALPPATFKFVPAAGADSTAMETACLGWVLGCYSFDKYKKSEDKDGKPAPPRVQAQLVWPDGVNRETVRALAASFFWARDLITTPAEDMGPGHLVQEATAMAHEHGAAISVVRGDDLLQENYPAVHTVGRAAARPPALIDIRWTPIDAVDVASLPRLTLVGKGVCFDSGGLDLKSAAGMKLMKKDMGGAALMLAVAHAVMSHNLSVRLRVMVPAVENAVSGNAYRPLDVLRTRAGISVENGNTDAEGRLILSDALFEAATEEPDLLIDAATLTGAARTALGPDLPAVFTNCDDTWQQFCAAANKAGDYVWRLPLHVAYRKALDSKVADVSSTGGEGAQGGAILAALFLSEFTKKAPRWVHIDTPAWVAGGNTGPGRPEGGEVQAFRALWTWLQTRYGRPA